MEKILFEDFKKVEIAVGEILTAEKIPETDKLIKLTVDFGLKPSLENVSPDYSSETDDLERRDIRQIVSGISAYFPDESVLVGKKCMFVVNLEPRKIKGYESNGMLFAVSTEDGAFSLLEPNANIPNGTRAK